MILPRVLEHKKVPITGNTLITPVTVTIYLCSCYIFVSNAGTTWALQIKDKDPAGASVIYNMNPLVLTTVPTSLLNGFNLLPMIGGIDIQPSGGTPGAATVWLVYGHD